jgi:hypothetical protein
MTTGFLLLRKCVPGIEKLNRPGMLMETVKYIMELQNKVSELEKRNTTPMESTQLTPTDCTGMKRDSVPKITLHYYPVQSTATESDCTESVRREPQMAEYSEITGLSSLMADYSDISEPNSPTGQMVTDILEMADLTPMEDHSTVEMVTDEIAVNSEEEEELPEFHSVEDLRQWLGL